MSQAVIVSAVRTAVGREAGALREVPPEDLAAIVMREAVNRSGLSSETIEEVLFGNCFSCLANVARIGVLKAGLPISLPAIQIDRQCASGSTALNLTAALIQAGIHDVVLTGGVESMSRVPWVMQRATAPYQRIAPPVFSLLEWPRAPKEIGDPPMGITAENVAERWKISREEQDEFAFYSQQKAARALREDRFKDQIVPVSVPQKKGPPIVVDVDEHPRPDVTLDLLAKLGPAFKPGGTVTAGNSSGTNDGAAAMIVTSRQKALELGAQPLATVIAFAAAGVDPNIMGIGPVPASQKAMAKTGLTIADFDVIELNEAFAAPSIACCRELGIDWRDRDRDRINPNGGAIALGHPIAASLAVLVVKAIYELHRRDGRYGLVTACCGGGQGVATIIERSVLS